MLNIRRVVAIILLVTPLTFFGQGRGSYKIRENDKPITRVKPDFTGKNNTKSKLYFQASIGPTILNADNGGKKLGVEGNIGVGYQIHKFVGVEARIGYAFLQGKYDNIGRIVSQKSDLFEGNINLMLNLTNIILGVDSGRRFDIIPHVGIGQVQSRGRVEYENGNVVSFGYKDYDSPQNNTNLVDGKVQYGYMYFKAYGGGIGKRVVSLTVPMGIDFVCQVTKSLKIHLDFITNYVDTDRLDAVPAGKARDWYSSVQMRFQIKLHEKTPSPCDNLFYNYR